ncbi:MAG TPA: arylamine N-acetyltransferase [Terriglobales bacterium]|nr:arylamine N-acetyltransferase [Terriglobales bacterium]
MDVQAYLQRIHYPGSLTPGVDLPSVDRPSIDLLRALHRAHMFTVPFENLDIGLGREIVCEESSILHKIVDEHRGGFCYELNGAFAALLRAVGFQVTLLSARVAREDGSYGPEFDHLTLRVDLEGPWLADVGFGEGFLEPLRLESGTEQAQCRRAYRLTSLDKEFVLEVMADGKWKTEYAFTLQPRELPDFAGMCHYHQTSPESHFTRQRICSMATPEGRVSLSDEKLIETRGGSKQERLLSGDQEWRAILRELFGVILPQ